MLWWQPPRLRVEGCCRRDACFHSRSPAKREAIEQLLKLRFQFWDLLERRFQRYEVARVTGSLAQPADGAFDIANRLQFRPNRVEQVRLLQEIGNHLLAASELGQLAQRLQYPGAQLACAHRCDRSVQNRKQADVARAARFNQLEIGLRCGIE